MKTSGENGAGSTSGQDNMNAHQVEEGTAAVVGNARLTAQASAVLLVLLLIELVTVPTLSALISLHLFVGILLLGPLAVKLGSTGYRFVHYYTRASAFVRQGPPRLALRLLAPLLVVTTLVLFGSGLGLMLTTPSQAGLLRPLHIFSFLLWLPLLASHVVAHFGRLASLIGDEWRNYQPTKPASPRSLRLSIILGGVLGGVLAALVMLPVAAPWLSWFGTNETGPGPFIVGLLLALFGLLVTRPLRWR